MRHLQTGIQTRTAAWVTELLLAGMGGAESLLLHGPQASSRLLWHAAGRAGRRVGGAVDRATKSSAACWLPARCLPSHLQRRVPLAAVAAEHHLHKGLDQILQGGHVAQILQQAGGWGAWSINEEYVRMQAGLDRQTP